MSTAYHIAPPFLQADPQKRKFHVDMFAAAPAENCVTVTYLDERPIAAFWGAVSGKTVHLGMVMHAPFLAKHSPGKLHLMQLSEHLLKEGKEVLDLTPGGEPWKERSANAHEEVAEAVICASPWVAMWTGTLEWGKRCADRAGVTPADVDATLARLDQLRPSAVTRKVRNWADMKRELRTSIGAIAPSQNVTVTMNAFAVTRFATCFPSGGASWGQAVMPSFPLGKRAWNKVSLLTRSAWTIALPTVVGWRQSG